MKENEWSVEDCENIFGTIIVVICLAIMMPQVMGRKQ